MWVTANAGVPLSGLTPTANWFNSSNRVNGWAYDAAGNQTISGTYTLAYDAENRQTSATESPAMGSGWMAYDYDGLGRRVAKVSSSGVTTVYAYDAFGSLAAEYSSQAADTPACVTCYLSWDHLGSTRLVTDSSGNVVSRHDYLSFGEEVPNGWAGRNSEWGETVYPSQKFTGQFRDEETGLDYFNARYFGAALGSGPLRRRPRCWRS